MLKTANDPFTPATPPHLPCDEPAQSHTTETDTKANHTGLSVIAAIRNRTAQFVGNAVGKAVLSGASYFLTSTQKEDEEFLRKLTGENVSLGIKKLAPQLPLAIQSFLSESMAAFAKSQKSSIDQVTEALMIHVIANLAASIYPNEAKAFYSKNDFNRTVPLKQLTREVTSKLISILADEFNKIDAQVNSEEDITVQHFNELATRIIDLMLPQQKSGLMAASEKHLANYLIFDLAKLMMRLYKPLGFWLLNKEIPAAEGSSFNHIISVLEKFGAYIANSMADYHIDEDRQLIQNLTGKENVQDLIAILSPKIFNGLLNSETIEKLLQTLPFDLLGILKRNLETVDNVGTAVFLRIVSNIAQEVFADEIRTKKTIGVDDFVVRMATGISEIFGTFFHEVNHLPMPLKDEQFKPLALNLLVTILPKNEHVQSFLVRRGDRLTEKLSNFLRRTYENFALRNDAEIYKQRLRKVLINEADLRLKLGDEILPEEPTAELSQQLGTEKLVNQLFNVCYNATNIVRGFAASKLTKADVIVEQIQTTFKNQHLDEKLFDGIADGIAELMLKDHKVSDPLKIAASLSKIHDPAFDETLRSEIALLVVDISETVTISDPHVLLELLETHQKFTSLQLDTKKNICKEIIDSIYASNPLHWITPTIQNALHVTLFKGIVHLLEKVPANKRNKKELFAAALQILLDVQASELPKITESLRHIADPLSPEYIELKKDRDKKTKEIMAPYIDKMIHIFFEDQDINGDKLEDHLPLPDEFKGFAAGLIKDNMHIMILPMIKATTMWIDTKKENKERLDGLFKNQHASEACRVVGALTSQAVPYSLQEFHSEIADLVTKQATFLFTTQTGVEPSAKELKKLRNMIDHTLLSFAHNDSDSMKDLLKFVENFAESAFLRCFADLAQGLQAMDLGHKDDPQGSFLVQGTTLILEEVQKHLAFIAEAKADLKQYNAKKIAHEDLVNKFKEKNHLHPAVEDPAEKTKFFVELSKKIFHIIGVNKNINLPIVHFLKAPLWDLFEGELMPLLLVTLFEKAKDPHTLNLLLINLFEQINATAGNIDVTIPDDQIRRYKDASQDKLEEINGKLIQALVQMQPSSVTKWALKNDKVREFAGQAMGQPLREILEEKNILSLIDEMIVSLIPALHPGEWDSKTGAYIYTKGTGKRKKVLDQPNFVHLLPRTDKEKKIYEKKHVHEVKQAQEDVVNQITHSIENQTKYIFLGFFRKFWRKMRAAIDKAIDVTFKKYSPGIKKFVNALLDGLAKYLIKPALFIATYPVYFIVKRLLRFYFVLQSSIRAEDVNHKIHENVFLRGIEEIVEFVRAAKNPQDPETATA